MIITLAGHVDHGKTSLVKVLTGTDTDRLKEEKQRGLTIDLGFAYIDLDGVRVGFVDVPGHHRFVHNMVAGVAANQYALLVVAADDGPMPQTLEHLNILSLLGVKRGCIVITKMDQVSEKRLQSTQHSIRDLVHDTFLEHAAILPLSNVTQTGVPALRQHLRAAAGVQNPAAVSAGFRLAIDRAFTIKGAGLVVTGTVTSGALDATTQLVTTPSGEKVKMRGLHVSNLPASTAKVGDRCAINITGTTRNRISRGAWLLEEFAFFPVRRLLLELQWLSPGQRHFPTHQHAWRALHVHHATTHTTGQLRLLNDKECSPVSQLAELLLDKPLLAKHNDRLILRDAAAESTLGGGRVIRVHEHRKPADRRNRLQHLAAYLCGTAEACLQKLLQDGGDIELFRQTWNLTPAQLGALLHQSNAYLVEFASHKLAYSPATLQAMCEQVLTILQHCHKSQPEIWGLSLSEVVAALDTISPKRPGLLPAVLNDLVRRGKITTTGNRYHLTSHSIRKDPVNPLLEKIKDLCQHTQQPLQPPSLGDLAQTIGIEQSTLLQNLNQLSHQKLMMKISANRFFLPQQIKSLAELALQLFQERGDFTVRDYRDFTKLGRNVAIEVLEFFDRKGFTRRLHDHRRIIRDIGHVLD